MTKISHSKIEDADDAWEPEGPLGHDEQFVQPAPDDASAVDSALDLHPISIRLQRKLLDDLKGLAQLNGLGYQPLIRQILTRYVDCELRAILNDKIAREATERMAAHEAESAPAPRRQRKVA